MRPLSSLMMVSMHSGGSRGVFFFSSREGTYVQAPAHRTFGASLTADLVGWLCGVAGGGAGGRIGTGSGISGGSGGAVSGSGIEAAEFWAAGNVTRGCC